MDQSPACRQAGQALHPHNDLLGREGSGKGASVPTIASPRAHIWLQVEAEAGVKFTQRKSTASRPGPNQGLFRFLRFLWGGRLRGNQN